MSKPHASPNEPCPRCVVRNRLLRSPHPYCSNCMDHVWRAANRGLPPVVASLSVTGAPGWQNEQRQLYLIEWHRAVLMGHDMQAIEDDTEPGGHLSTCAACDGWLVGDPFEADITNRPTPFYGRAYQTECPGAPPVPPANRRDIMDEAAPSTSLAHEWPDINPPIMDVVSWYDAHTDALMKSYRGSKRHSSGPASKRRIR